MGCRLTSNHCFEWCIFENAIPELRHNLKTVRFPFRKAILTHILLPIGGWYTTSENITRCSISNRFWPRKPMNMFEKARKKNRKKKPKQQHKIACHRWCFPLWSACQLLETKIERKSHTKITKNTVFYVADRVLSLWKCVSLSNGPEWIPITDFFNSIGYGYSLHSIRNSCVDYIHVSVAVTL